MKPKYIALSLLVGLLVLMTMNVQVKADPPLCSEVGWDNSRCQNN